MAALLDHFNGVPPDDVGAGHKIWLVDEINIKLNERPDFRAKFPKGGKVSNMMVSRALAAVRKRNR
jgi:hypothetical protein